MDRNPFFDRRLISSHREIHVPHGEDAERDEPSRIGATPLVDVPVVVRLEHHQREFLVGGLGEGPGIEAGHGGEAHRGEYAVGVHVPHPVVHVEAARSQLGEGAGVEAPFLAGPSDRGRHSEPGRGRLALEDPLVHPLLVADDLRHLV